MADNEPDTSDPRQVASVTFAYLRRIDNTLIKVMETLLRHETRLGRIERDIGEVKSDIVLLENRILTQANEILRVVQRIDEHQGQLDGATTQP
jgi:uncharacterized protein YaaR (DUF327 family)